jgi:hypothetical protein
MTSAAESLDRTHAALSEAKAHAQHMARVFAFGFSDCGVPRVLSLIPLRADLARALRAAGDAAEQLGVELGDIRWTATVTLIHNASMYVWSARDTCTCNQIADLLERLRYRIDQLRNMRQGRYPVVTLN